MLVVLLVILTLVLLVAIVYGLRRYQLQESETNADRQSPLPPLDLNSVTPLQDVEEEPIPSFQSRPQTHNEQPRAGSEALNGQELPRADAYQEPGIVIAGPADMPAEPAPEVRAAPVNWLQECNELKASGELEAALAVSETALPQWGAFNQAATILRAIIRRAQKDGADIEPFLAQLFRLAACASFLHDKLPDLPPLSPRQLRQLPDSAWMPLEMPYARIGYQELRLLGKSDQKLLRECWGEPAEHQSARLYHQDSWARLLQIYGS